MLVVLVLGLFLLASLAFSADYTKMWFHRQKAQAAADAVCMAGATDLLMQISGVPGLNPVTCWAPTETVRRARLPAPCAPMPNTTAIPRRRGMPMQRRIT